jgi:hypothetical protein
MVCRPSLSPFGGLLGVIGEGLQPPAPAASRRPAGRARASGRPPGIEKLPGVEKLPAL